MAAEYQLIWQTPAGATLGVLDEIIECRYARTENDIGEMSLVLPDYYYSESWFQPYSRILVMRTLAGADAYLDLQTPWFVIDGPYFELDDEGRQVVRLTAWDALGFILTSRNIAYNDNNAFTLKLDPADDMLKAVVRENAGSLASDSNRDLSNNLYVAADESIAPIIRYGSFSRQPMLSVLQGICQASAQDDTPTWLGFDIGFSSGPGSILEFRSYTSQRGNDHRWPNGSPPYILTAEAGNLSQPQVGTSYREVATYIYAGGPGVEDIRSIATSQDEELEILSPFGRREKFVDGSQITDAASLETLARSSLREARPRRTLQGRLVETANMLRGVHWDYGDYLTASYRGLQYDVRVEKIAVTLTSGGDGGLVEETEVLLRGDEIG